MTNLNNETRELNLNDLEAVSGGALNGIAALIAVTQMKVDNANNNAMDGATKMTTNPRSMWSWQLPAY